MNLMGEGEKKERMETVTQQQQNQVPSTLPEMEQEHISRKWAHIKPCFPLKPEVVFSPMLY